MRQQKAAAAAACLPFIPRHVLQLGINCTSDRSTYHRGHYSSIYVRLPRFAPLPQRQSSEDKPASRPGGCRASNEDADTTLISV